MLFDVALGTPVVATNVGGMAAKLMERAGFKVIAIVEYDGAVYNDKGLDIRALAEYFLAEFCARNNFKSKSFDPDVVDTLEDHHWPGNIRELRNTVERMAILTKGDILTGESIPVEIRLSRGAAPPGLRSARSDVDDGTTVTAWVRASQATPR